MLCSPRRCPRLTPELQDNKFELCFGWHLVATTNPVSPTMAEGQVPSTNSVFWFGSWVTVALIGLTIFFDVAGEKLTDLLWEVVPPHMRFWFLRSVPLA